MIYIIVIALAFALAGIVYSGFLMMIYPIYDYFFHSRWGLLAILTLILSYIFGMASKRIHEEVKLKDEIMTSLKIFIADISNSFNKNIKSTNYLSFNNNKLMENKKTESLINLGNNEYEIDISKMNFDGVLKSFAKAVNQPFPIFFINSSNNRVRAKVERVKIINDYLVSVRELGKEFQEFQVDALFSKDKIAQLLEKRKIENKNELDILTAQGKEIVDKYNKIIEEREILTKILDARLRKDNANVEKEELTNNILRTAIDKWDNLTPEQVDIIKNILNPSQSSDGFNSIDKDYARMEVLLKEKEVNAKEIENLKSDIERKQMNDKYKANKRQI